MLLRVLSLLLSKWNDTGTEYALVHLLIIYREPLLIIGHQGILRIIYAFYTGLNRADSPFVSIPLNTVIKLTPTAYDCNVEVSRLLIYSTLLLL